MEGSCRRAVLFEMVQVMTVAASPLLLSALNRLPHPLPLLSSFLEELVKRSPPLSRGEAP